MALNKAQLQANLTQQQAKQVDEYERKIDAELTARYDGGPMSISLAYPSNMRVWDELCRRYEQAGWKLRSESDIKEGKSYLSIS